MHAILLLLLLSDPKPLKLFSDIPPMDHVCKSGTPAVQFNKDNEEKARCRENLKCSDKTPYGAGACVCKSGMPLLDQDDVVVGCTAPEPKGR